MIDQLISKARRAARASGHVVAQEVVDAAVTLNQCADEGGSNTDRLRTPEYDRDEYLVNCEEGGTPTVTESLDISGLSTISPWIKWECNTVLVRRWLAHFVGLRHRVIHLFLDHPGHPDCTFAQIRSLAKYHSSGRVDMPVGGHVTNLDDLDASLEREFLEELGLKARQDLVNLRPVGTFTVTVSDDLPDHIDVDHSTVFRAAIKPYALERLRFQAGEVGALALFRVDELNRWIHQRPSDVGEGLRDAWQYYDGG